MQLNNTGEINLRPLHPQPKSRAMKILKTVVVSLVVLTIAIEKLEAAPQGSVPSASFRLLVRSSTYRNTERTQTTTQLILPDAQPFELNALGGVWSYRATAVPVPGMPDATDYVVISVLKQGKLLGASVSVELQFDRWIVDNYVCLPGAVYAGNRFESRRLTQYPPLLKDPADIGPDVPTIITDIPRLNLHQGPSRIQQVARDLATPAVGIHFMQTRKGLWLLTPQGGKWGHYGIDVEESDDRRQATVRITQPFMREKVMYKMLNRECPSYDRPADFAVGDVVEFRFRVHAFNCQDIPSLMSRFLTIRKTFSDVARDVEVLPFSAAWRIQEEKYNRENWVETHGYYAVEINHSPQRVWTAGWVGGLQVTLPLLIDGDENSRQRVFRNFDYVFPKGVGPSGFIYGAAVGESFVGDGQLWCGPNETLAKRRWHLVRKSGDVLYYGIKQLQLLEQQDPSWEAPDAWVKGLRGCADAFVRLWDKRGQFGQFVNIDTGDVAVGGSTSAAIAPAALALASRYFSNPDYLRVAKAAARQYVNRDLIEGYTNGGPLEILQAPDYESSYGLVESLVTLYEVTGDRQWIEDARKAGDLFATWCVSYDCPFPPASLYGRMGMKTTGTCYASAQNKCAVPGICTHSGIALFKLYRATGERLYMELLQDITRALPQYLSRADRPIAGMKPGWMCERVEMGDWLGPPGEIFKGSCWCEVSLMLTYAEVPGVYVQPDTGLVAVFDHVQVSVTQRDKDGVTLELVNPTQFEASVKVFSEASTACSRPLGQNFLSGCSRVNVPARGRAKLRVNVKEEGKTRKARALHRAGTDSCKVCKKISRPVDLDRWNGSTPHPHRRRARADPRRDPQPVRGYEPAGRLHLIGFGSFLPRVYREPDCLPLSGPRVRLHSRDGRASPIAARCSQTNLRERKAPAMKSPCICTRHVVTLAMLFATGGLASRVFGAAQTGGIAAASDRAARMGRYNVVWSGRGSFWKPGCSQQE